MPPWLTVADYQNRALNELCAIAMTLQETSTRQWEQPGREHGFTLIELLIVCAVISTIAIFAVPGLLRARMTANETSAIASLRITAVAQVAYASACGANRYAATYLVLGTPLTTGGEAFLSGDLGLSTTPQKSGYNFALDAGTSSTRGTDCEGRPTITGFYATAAPQGFRVSGSRSFAVDKSSTIWQSLSNTPPSEPFVTGPTISTLR
jgi:prepilin-type N-terminal cleavage/methylation domain-containing protein